jgi:hypothetical protein
MEEWGATLTVTTFKEGLLEKSRLAQHAYEEDHRVDWDRAGILSFEKNIIRKYKESAYMSWEGNSISQLSLEFSPLWLPLISNEISNIHNYKNRDD